MAVKESLKKQYLVKAQSKRQKMLHPGQREKGLIKEKVARTLQKDYWMENMEKVIGKKALAVNIIRFKNMVTDHLNNL